MTTNPRQRRLRKFWQSAAIDGGRGARCTVRAATHIRRKGNPMKTTPPLLPDAPALVPELAALIDRGVLSRAEGEQGVDLGAWLALSRELVTAQQAAVLGQMLGLAAA